MEDVSPHTTLDRMGDATTVANTSEENEVLTSQLDNQQPSEGNDSELVESFASFMEKDPQDFEQPTPLISEDVASAMACNVSILDIGATASDIVNVNQIQGNRFLIEVDDTERHHPTVEMFMDGPPIETFTRALSPILQHPVLLSLDEILMSINSQAIGDVYRSIYDLVNVCLPFSEIDSFLTAFGVTLPLSPYVLHNAVFQKDVPVIFLIMRSRYRYMVNERDSLGRTPLHIALLAGDYTSLQLLLVMPIGPYPVGDENEIQNAVEVEFPDISLKFNHLPAFHLPLARAGWTECLPDVLATYTLLFAYAEVARRSLESRDLSFPGMFVLAATCGWRQEEASSSSHEESRKPLYGAAWALDQLAEFMESRKAIGLEGWSVNARDGSNCTALHRASELGVADIVERLLDAGADPLLKDCNGDLPVHRCVDSGDPDTFAVLLRRGGTALVRADHFDSGDTGCDPWSEDTSIMALFRRCILRGSWRCLGRLVTDEVYSQFPIPEAAMDGLLDFASLCGYTEEFGEAFKMAVDNAEPQKDGPMRKALPEKLEVCELKIFTHDTCFDHFPLPDIDKIVTKRLKLLSRFPENPSRLYCLTPLKSGILRTRWFNQICWDENPPTAAMADILRVHDWSYIKTLIQRVEKVSVDAQLFKNTKPFFFHEVDTDTPVTPGSWEAAKRAAGAVISAVKSVCRGEVRQAFCAIRPPGHHVGTWGACQPPPGDSSWQHEKDEDWANGSQGFCLLNNIAIGAAYARYNFASSGINRIAIVDFDVHHGNGTEQVILNLKPRERKLSFAAHHHLDTAINVELRSDFWKLWLDETDTDNVFFVSIHGFGNRFYPGTGGLAVREHFPNVHNVAIDNGITLEEFKEEFRNKVVEPLLEFNPDLVLISAGFDAHNHDAVNEGFGVCSEFDYFWMTRYLVAVANECCDGRIVSVLEGGYNTKAGTLSPLAQSVACHVKGFLQTPPGLTLSAAKLLDKLTRTSTPLVDTISSPNQLLEHAIDTFENRRSLDVINEETIRPGIKRREVSPSSTAPNDNVEAAPKRPRRAAAAKALEKIEEKMHQKSVSEKMKSNVD